MGLTVSDSGLQVQRFPPGFLDAVEAHLRRMETAEAA